MMDLPSEGGALRDDNVSRRFGKAGECEVSRAQRSWHGVWLCWYNARAHRGVPGSLSRVQI
jgi:hypothetical protein